MMIPTMTPVESSQIESIGHDPATNTLHVKFLRGGHFSYAGVDAAKHAETMKAESHGKFLGQHIKGKHEFTKHAKT